MDGQTLQGKKLDIYALLKIIKYCTGSSVPSYQCKFAVNRVYRNKKLWGIDVAINNIIQYHTIRGKFSSVHPDLVAEGITRVEIGKEGLRFIKAQEAGKPFSESCCSCIGFKFQRICTMSLSPSRKRRGK